jgi:hypothetical protein
VRNDNEVKVYERSGRSNDVWGNWNGKNQRTDEPVRVGLYKATLVMTNNHTGETDSSTIRLHAKSDIVDRRITKTRNGADTSSRWRQGDCVVTRNGWFDGPNSLYLDCRGGRTGVKYNFTLPQNARNISWAGNGSHGFGWDGRIIKDGDRIGPKRFQVSVTVTGWEAYSIKRASVTYTTAVRR